MANIGELSVVIGADPSEFKRAMSEMKSGLSDINRKIGKAERDWKKSFGNIEKYARQMNIAMTAAGAAIVGGLFKLTDEYTKAGDEVAKMAKRTGFGVEALSELRYAADLSGTSLTDLETSIKRMSNFLLDVEDGLATSKRSLDKLGLSIEDISKLSPEEKFWAIAEAIADIEDPTEKSALAMDVFGKSGTNLLPMLESGADGIAQMRQEARDLNLVFDSESAAAAEAFQDAQTKIKGAMEGLGATIGQAVMPSLTELITKLTEIVGKVKDWAKEHPGLFDALLKLGGVLVVGGALLLGLATMASLFLKINQAMIVMKGLLPVLTGLLGTSSTTGLAGSLGLVGLALGGIAGWAIAIKSIVDNFESWVELMKQAPWQTFMNLITKGTLIDYKVVELTPGTAEKAAEGKKKAEANATKTTTSISTPDVSTDSNQTLNDWFIKIFGGKNDRARQAIIDSGGIPNFKYGGTVPGPIGAPMLAEVHGGETYSGLQNIGSLRSNGDNFYFTIQGSVKTEQDLITAVKKGLAERNRLNFFGPSLSGYGSGTSGL